MDKEHMRAPSIREGRCEGCIGGLTGDTGLQVEARSTRQGHRPQAVGDARPARDAIDKGNCSTIESQTLGPLCAAPYFSADLTRAESRAVATFPEPPNLVVRRMMRRSSSSVS